MNTIQLQKEQLDTLNIQKPGTANVIPCTRLNTILLTIAALISDHSQCHSYDYIKCSPQIKVVDTWFSMPAT